ncbi:MAG: phosphodiesterase [Proteobacteria bacterium]|nr:phosphodiesterase [Pseudomonadota bacterium]
MRLLRVLHLTDPHLFADLNGSLRGTVTFASLSAVLAHYQAGNWRADLVMVTGDLVQDDSKEAYVHFRALLKSLDLPVYCVPGNHDVRALMQAALNEPPFYYCDTVVQDRWLIVGLDSCIADQAGGSVSDAELARLDAVIAASDTSHVMVCLHHPPVAMGSKWLDSVGLANGYAVLARLARSGKVRLTISGHVHQDYEAEHVGIRIIATPSTCSQFAVRSDEFAIDDHPPAYRRIELDADGQHSNELIWVASG